MGSKTKWFEKFEKRGEFCGEQGFQNCHDNLFDTKTEQRKRESPGAPKVLLDLLCAIDALVFRNFIQSRYMIEVASDHKHACEPGIVIAFHSSSKGHGISH